MAHYQFILDNGVTPETLTVNPMNWDEMGITLLRSDDYHSMLRNFTLPLKYGNITGGGYDYLLSAYNTYGIYANVLITINYKDSNTNDWLLFYSGKIDFKPPKFNIERDLYIEAAIVDNDKLEKLKAREETEFNIYDTITPDGVTIPAITNKKTVNLPDIPILLEYDSQDHFLALVNNTISLGGTRFGYVNPSASPEDVLKNSIGAGVTIDGGFTIYTNTHDTDIEGYLYVSFDYVFIAYNTTNPIDNGTANLRNRIYAKYFNSSGVQQNQLLLYDVTTLIDVSEYALGELIFTHSGTLTGELSNTVDPNGYIEFYSKHELTVVDSMQMTITLNNGATFNKLYISELTPGIGTTTTDCYFPDEIFTHLIQLITSETDTSKLFRSELFGRTDSEYETYSVDGDYSKFATFTGKMCRKFPDEIMNISIKKYFKFFNSCYNLGMGYDYVNDRFYIAGKSSFYDSNVLIKDLGEVKNLKIMPNSKSYFSEIETGFDYDGDYEDYNGALEFNLKKYYSTPAPVKEKLDLIAPYRADSIGIQLTRNKQYYANSTIDTKGDNDIFLVKTDGTDPTKVFLIGGFWGSNYYYNSEITPRQNMVRWGNVIGQSLFRNDNPIKYVKSDKQFNLQIYSDGSTYIDENTDIAKSELGDLLYIPEMVSIEAALEEGDLQTILANPHGHFHFTYRGKSYSIFADKIEIKDYKLSVIIDGLAMNTEVIYRTFEDENLHVFTDDNQKING